MHSNTQMLKKIVTSILVFSFFFEISAASVAFAALSCTVATSCSGGVVVLRMNTLSNSHAELPSQANYPELVCCSGVTGLANTCSDDFAVLLRLSGATNAHVEENSQATATYNGHNVCISVPDGTVSVGYQDTNCSGFDTTVLSMATPITNSHVGDAGSYTRKVCASASVTTTPPPCSNVSCNGGGGGAKTPDIAAILRIADFNGDGRVDILDLSILLYYIDQGDNAYSRFDLNQDGVLDFKDVSILFYYWNVFS